MNGKKRRFESAHLHKKGLTEDFSQTLFVFSATA